MPSPSAKFLMRRRRSSDGRLSPRLHTSKRKRGRGDGDGPVAACRRRRKSDTRREGDRNWVSSPLDHSCYKGWSNPSLMMVDFDVVAAYVDICPVFIPSKTLQIDLWCYRIIYWAWIMLQNMASCILECRRRI